MFQLKPNTVIYKASNQFGRDIPCFVDWSERVFFYESYDGPSECFIQARSWEDAYGIMLDNAQTIPEEELYKAYGFESSENFHQALKAEQFPELAEGFQYQDNSTGTGIVWVGYSEHLEPVTVNMLREKGITLQVRHVNQEVGGL